MCHVNDDNTLWDEIRESYLADCEDLYGSHPLQGSAAHASLLCTNGLSEYIDLKHWQHVLACALCH